MDHCLSFVIECKFFIIKMVRPILRLILGALAFQFRPPHPHSNYVHFLYPFAFPKGATMLPKATWTAPNVTLSTASNFLCLIEHNASFIIQFLCYCHLVDKLVHFSFSGVARWSPTRSVAQSYPTKIYPLLPLEHKNFSWCMEENFAVTPSRSTPGLHCFSHSPFF